MLSQIKAHHVVFGLGFSLSLIL